MTMGNDFGLADVQISIDTANDAANARGEGIAGTRDAEGTVNEDLQTAVRNGDLTPTQALAVYRDYTETRAFLGDEAPPISTLIGKKVKEITREAEEEALDVAQAIEASVAKAYENVDSKWQTAWETVLVGGLQAIETDPSLDAQTQAMAKVTREALEPIRDIEYQRYLTEVRQTFDEESKTMPQGTIVVAPELLEEIETNGALDFINENKGRLVQEANTLLSRAPAVAQAINNQFDVVLRELFRVAAIEKKAKVDFRNAMFGSSPKGYYTRLAEAESDPDNKHQDILRRYSLALFAESTDGLEDKFVEARQADPTARTIDFFNRELPFIQGTALVGTGAEQTSQSMNAFNNLDALIKFESEEEKVRTSILKFLTPATTKISELLETMDPTSPDTQMLRRALRLMNDQVDGAVRDAVGSPDDPAEVASQMVSRVLTDLLRARHEQLQEAIPEISRIPAGVRRELENRRESVNRAKGALEQARVRLRNARQRGDEAAIREAETEIAQLETDLEVAQLRQEQAQMRTGESLPPSPGIVRPGSITEQFETFTTEMGRLAAPAAAVRTPQEWYEEINRFVENEGGVDEFGNELSAEAKAVKKAAMWQMRFDSLARETEARRRASERTPGGGEPSGTLILRILQEIGRELGFTDREINQDVDRMVVEARVPAGTLVPKKLGGEAEAEPLSFTDVSPFQQKTAAQVQKEATEEDAALTQRELEASAEALGGVSDPGVQPTPSESDIVVEEEAGIVEPMPRPEPAGTLITPPTAADIELEASAEPTRPTGFVAAPPDIQLEEAAGGFAPEKTPEPSDVELEESAGGISATAPRRKSPRKPAN